MKQKPKSAFRGLFLFIFVVPKILCTNESFVVSSTESTINNNENNTNVKNEINPRIYSMDIFSNVSNRFATTVVTSRMRNILKTPAEATFSVILPNNAFISGFLMEIQGKIYKAEVKEKGESSKIYENAKSEGKTAAKVETNTRDSHVFTVSVNIEPESKTIFKLTYEELLRRELGKYELILNIQPEQIVDDLNVEVHIAESRLLKFVKTPALRTGNEISKTENEKLDPHAQIEIRNGNSAVVKFKPDKEDQKQFAEFLNVADKDQGIKGQFVVQYDVIRYRQGTEVLVSDGYFVHFFAPSDLEPIPKHVVFVLDHSGSMSGEKIDQLIDAMQNIMSGLRSEDVFHLVRFGAEASVWDINKNMFQPISIENPTYGELESTLKDLNLPKPLAGNEHNVDKAKQIITDKSNLSSTNIMAGLEIGLFLLNRNANNVYQPMLFFLTDGLPNEGLVDANKIIETVKQLNSEPNRSAIFCLSFGGDADKDFLQRLSLDNLGFSRHIYEAADASFQLENFYKTISSPLLKNVIFKYIDGVSNVTKLDHPILFEGSELVVSGKTTENMENISFEVNAIDKKGSNVYLKPLVKKPVSNLERLWAYLTTKEILEESKIDVENKEELRKKALNLALKYSFVTEVSSLVVVKPDGNYSLDIGNTRKHSHTSHVHSSHGGRRGRGRSRSKSRSNSKLELSLLDSFNQTLGSVTNNTWEITIPQGVFKFGEPGDVKVNPDCILFLDGDNITGECRMVYECPSNYYVFTSLRMYTSDYFCALENRYAGVCCPKNSSRCPCK